jgi:7,8-dihydroneopterin aldolase/epimerase/oxygenase
MQTRSGEWIKINDLEVRGRVGVPENERETPQRLLVSLRFQIETTFAAVNDQLTKTIDYAAVTTEIEKVVEISRAHLIEKLILDIGNVLMARFPMRHLEVEVKKFILPNARYVSVTSDWERDRG